MPEIGKNPFDAIEKARQKRLEDYAEGFIQAHNNIYPAKRWDRNSVISDISFVLNLPEEQKRKAFLSMANNNPTFHGIQNTWDDATKIKKVRAELARLWNPFSLEKTDPSFINELATDAGVDVSTLDLEDAEVSDFYNAYLDQKKQKYSPYQKKLSFARGLITAFPYYKNNNFKEVQVLKDIETISALPIEERKEKVALMLLNRDGQLKPGKINKQQLSDYIKQNEEKIVQFDNMLRDKIGYPKVESKESISAFSGVPQAMFDKYFGIEKESKPQIPVEKTAEIESLQALEELTLSEDAEDAAQARAFLNSQKKVLSNMLSPSFAFAEKALEAREKATNDLLASHVGVRIPLDEFRSVLDKYEDPKASDLFEIEKKRLLEQYPNAEESQILELLTKDVVSFGGLKELSPEAAERRLREVTEKPKSPAGQYGGSIITNKSKKGYEREHEILSEAIEKYRSYLLVPGDLFTSDPINKPKQFTDKEKKELWQKSMQEAQVSNQKKYTALKKLEQAMPEASDYEKEALQDIREKILEGNYEDLNEAFFGAVIDRGKSNLSNIQAKNTRAIASINIELNFLNNKWKKLDALRARVEGLEKQGKVSIKDNVIEVKDASALPLLKSYAKVQKEFQESGDADKYEELRTSIKEAQELQIEANSVINKMAETFGDSQELAIRAFDETTPSQAKDLLLKSSRARAARKLTMANTARISRENAEEDNNSIDQEITRILEEQGVIEKTSKARDSVLMQIGTSLRAASSGVAGDPFSHLSASDRTKLFSGDPEAVSELKELERKRALNGLIVEFNTKIEKSPTTEDFFGGQRSMLGFMLEAVVEGAEGFIPMGKIDSSGMASDLTRKYAELSGRKFKVDRPIKGKEGASQTTEVLLEDLTDSELQSLGLFTKEELNVLQAIGRHNAFNSLNEISTGQSIAVNGLRGIIDMAYYVGEFALTHSIYKGITRGISSIPKVASNLLTKSTRPGSMLLKIGAEKVTSVGTKVLEKFPNLAAKVEKGAAIVGNYGPKSLAAAVQGNINVPAAIVTMNERQAAPIYEDENGHIRLPMVYSLEDVDESAVKVVTNRAIDFWTERIGGLPSKAFAGTGLFTELRSLSTDIVKNTIGKSKLSNYVEAFFKMAPFRTSQLASAGAWHGVPAEMSEEVYAQILTNINEGDPVLSGINEEFLGTVAVSVLGFSGIMSGIRVPKAISTLNAAYKVEKNTEANTKSFMARAFNMWDAYLEKNFPEHSALLFEPVVGEDGSPILEANGQQRTQPKFKYQLVDGQYKVVTLDSTEENPQVIKIENKELILPTKQVRKQKSTIIPGFYTTKDLDGMERIVPESMDYIPDFTKIEKQVTSLFPSGYAISFLDEKEQSQIKNRLEELYSYSNKTPEIQQEITKLEEFLSLQKPITAFAKSVESMAMTETVDQAIHSLYLRATEALGERDTLAEDFSNKAREKKAEIVQRYINEKLDEDFTKAGGEVSLVGDISDEAIGQKIKFLEAETAKGKLADVINSLTEEERNQLTTEFGNNEEVISAIMDGVSSPILQTIEDKLNEREQAEQAARRERRTSQTEEETIQASQEDPKELRSRRRRVLEGAVLGLNESQYKILLDSFGEEGNINFDELEQSLSNIEGDSILHKLKSLVLETNQALYPDLGVTYKTVPNIHGVKSFINDLDSRRRISLNINDSEWKARDLYSDLKTDETLRDAYSRILVSENPTTTEKKFAEYIKTLPTEELDTIFEIADNTDTWLQKKGLNRVAIDDITKARKEVVRYMSSVKELYGLKDTDLQNIYFVWGLDKNGKFKEGTKEILIDPNAAYWSQPASDVGATLLHEVLHRVFSIMDQKILNGIAEQIEANPNIIKKFLGTKGLSYLKRQGYDQKTGTYYKTDDKGEFLLDSRGEKIPAVEGEFVRGDFGEEALVEVLVKIASEKVGVLNKTKALATALNLSEHSLDQVGKTLGAVVSLGKKVRSLVDRNLGSRVLAEKLLSNPDAISLKEVEKRSPLPAGKFARSTYKANKRLNFTAVQDRKDPVNDIRYKDAVSEVNALSLLKDYGYEDSVSDPKILDIANKLKKQYDELLTSEDSLKEDKRSDISRAMSWLRTTHPKLAKGFPSLGGVSELMTEPTEVVRPRLSESDITNIPGRVSGITSPSNKMRRAKVEGFFPFSYLEAQEMGLGTIIRERGKETFVWSKTKAELDIDKLAPEGGKAKAVVAYTQDGETAVIGSWIERKKDAQDRDLWTLETNQGKKTFIADKEFLSNITISPINIKSTAKKKANYKVREQIDYYLKDDDGKLIKDKKYSGVIEDIDLDNPRPYLISDTGDADKAHYIYEDQIVGVSSEKHSARYGEEPLTDIVDQIRTQGQKVAEIAPGIETFIWEDETKRLRVIALTPDIGGMPFEAADTRQELMDKLSKRMSDSASELSAMGEGWSNYFLTLETLEKTLQLEIERLGKGFTLVSEQGFGYSYAIYGKKERTSDPEYAGYKYIFQLVNQGAGKEVVAERVISSLSLEDTIEDKSFPSILKELRDIGDSAYANQKIEIARTLRKDPIVASIVMSQEGKIALAAIHPTAYDELLEDSEEIYRGSFAEGFVTQSGRLFFRFPFHSTAKPLPEYFQEYGDVELFNGIHSVNINPNRITPEGIESARKALVEKGLTTIIAEDLSSYFASEREDLYVDPNMSSITNNFVALEEKMRKAEEEGEAKKQQAYEALLKVYAASMNALANKHIVRNSLRDWDEDFKQGIYDKAFIMYGIPNNEILEHDDFGEAGFILPDGRFLEIDLHDLIMHSFPRQMWADMVKAGMGPVELAQRLGIIRISGGNLGSSLSISATIPPTAAQKQAITRLLEDRKGKIETLFVDKNVSDEFGPYIYKTYDSAYQINQVLNNLESAFSVKIERSDIQKLRDGEFGDLYSQRDLNRIPSEQEKQSIKNIVYMFPPSMWEEELATEDTPTSKYILDLIEERKKYDSLENISPKNRSNLRKLGYDNLYIESLIPGQAQEILDNKIRKEDFIQLKKNFDPKIPYTVSIDRTLYSIRGELGNEGAEGELQKLITAKLLESEGKNPEQIYLATGWERGSDKMWRYDIGFEDYSLKVKPQVDKKYKLSDLISYPKLFEVYPNIANIKVTVKDIPGFFGLMTGNDKFWGVFGGMFGQKMSIDLSVNLLDQAGNPTKKFLSTLAHEIQHVIQRYEGFAVGGSSSEAWYSHAANIFGISYQLAPTWEKVLDKLSPFLMFVPTLPFEKVYNVVKSELLSGKSKHELYRNLLGEIEARNVEARLDLGEQRLSMPISDTEDIPRSKQLTTERLVQTINDTREALRIWPKLLKEGYPVEALQKLPPRDIVLLGKSLSSKELSSAREYTLSIPENVVQEKGLPKTFYHSSFSVFDSFDPRYSHALGIHVGSQIQAEDISWGGEGAHKDFEDQGKSMRPNTHKVYIIANNPIRMPDIGFGIASKVVNNLPKAVKEKLGKETLEEINNLSNSSSEFVAQEKLRNALQELGYDSIVYENKYEGKGVEPEDSYILFDDSQIISSIGEENLLYSSREEEVIKEGLKVLNAQKLNPLVSSWLSNKMSDKNIASAKQMLNKKLSDLEEKLSDQTLNDLKVLLSGGHLSEKPEAQRPIISDTKRKERIESYTKVVVERKDNSQISPKKYTTEKETETLFDYQDDAVNLIMDRYEAGERGFLLLDGPGTGKTLTELTVAQKIAQKGNPVIIVTDTHQIITDAFVRDSQKYGIPITVFRTQAEVEEKIKQNKDLRGGQIYVTTYANTEALAGVRAGLVILDESQNLINKTSNKSKNMVNLMRKADHVLLASATPFDQFKHLWYVDEVIPRRLHLSGLMEDLGLQENGTPKVGYTMEQVRQRLDRKLDQLTSQGLLLERHLPMNKVSVMDRVVDIPDRLLKRYQDYHTGKENSISALFELEKAKAVSASNIAESAANLGDKVIIFVESVNSKAKDMSTTDKLKMLLGRKNISYAVLTGNTQDRQKTIKQFQSYEANSPKVLIASTGVASAGLSLDDEAGTWPRTIVLMTPGMSAIPTIQQIGRAHRANTQSRVKVYRLFSNTPSDQWAKAYADKKLQNLGATVKGYSGFDTGFEEFELNRGPKLDIGNLFSERDEVPRQFTWEVDGPVETLGDISLVQGETTVDLVKPNLNMSFKSWPIAVRYAERRYALDVALKEKGLEVIAPAVLEPESNTIGISKGHWYAYLDINSKSQELIPGYVTSNFDFMPASELDDYTPEVSGLGYAVSSLNSYATKQALKEKGYNVNEEHSFFSMRDYTEFLERHPNGTQQEFVDYMRVPTPGTYQSATQVGSIEDEKLVIKAVLAGTKPVGTVAYTEHIDQVKKSDKLIFSDYMGNVHFALKSPNGEKALKLFENALAKEDRDMEELGRLLGYKDSEIQEFLHRRNLIDLIPEPDAFTEAASYIPTLSNVVEYLYSINKTPEEITNFVKHYRVDQAVKQVNIIDRLSTNKKEKFDHTKLFSFNGTIIPEEVLENKSFYSYRDTSNILEKVRAQETLRFIEERYLGIGISRQMRYTGNLSLLGRKVTNGKELAELMRIYRDPGMETLRVFFMKDGEVIHHTGVTSRLPGSVQFFIGDPNHDNIIEDPKLTMEEKSAIIENRKNKLTDDYVDQLRSQIVALKADGVYLLHNHPAGNAVASKSDWDFNKYLLSKLGDNYLGAMVINNRKYSFITPEQMEGDYDAGYIIGFDPDTKKYELIHFTADAGDQVAETVAEFPDLVTAFAAYEEANAVAEKEQKRIVFEFETIEDDPLLVPHRTAYGIKTVAGDHSQLQAIVDALPSVENTMVAIGRSPSDVVNGILELPIELSDKPETLKAKLLHMMEHTGSSNITMFGMPDNEVAQTLYEQGYIHGLTNHNGLIIGFPSSSVRLNARYSSIPMGTASQEVKFSERLETYLSKENYVEDFIGLLRGGKGIKDALKIIVPEFNSFNKAEKDLISDTILFQLRNRGFKNLNDLEAKVQYMNDDPKDPYNHAMVSETQVGQEYKPIIRATIDDDWLQGEYLTYKWLKKIFPSAFKDGTMSQKIRRKVSSMVFARKSLHADYLYPLKRVQEILSQLDPTMADAAQTLLRTSLKNGPDFALLEMYDAYLKEELMSGKLGLSIERLEKDLSDNFYPLLEGLTPAPGFDNVYEELHDLMYSLHTFERNFRVAQINPKFGTPVYLRDEAGALIIKEGEPTILGSIFNRNYLDGQGSGRTNRVAFEVLQKYYDDVTLEVWNPETGEIRYTQDYNSLSPDNVEIIRQVQVDNPKVDKKSQQLIQAQEWLKNNILKKNRESMVMSGLIPKEVAELWDKTYKHYIPLRSDIKAGMGSVISASPSLGVSGEEVKAALGRESEAAESIPFIIGMYENTLIRGHKNEIGRALYNLLTQFTEDIAQGLEIKEGEKQTLISSLTYKHTEKSALGKPITQEMPLFTIDAYKPKARLDGNGTVKYGVSKANPESGSSFIFKENGIEHHININYTPLSVALTGLGNSQKEMLLDPYYGFAGKKIISGIRSATNKLSKLYTAYSPYFLIYNGQRDTIGAFLNLASENVELKTMLQGNKMGLVSHMLPFTLSEARRAIVNINLGEIGKERKYNSEGVLEYEELYREMEKEGGLIRFYSAKKVKEIQKQLQEALEGGKESGKVFQFIENYNRVIETATRLMVFKMAKQGGYTPARAASLAKNITVNFNRRGMSENNFNKFLRTFYIFANANIQGITRLMDALKHGKGKKVAAQLINTAFWVAFANRHAAGEAPDGEAWWDKLSQSEKERNILIHNIFGEDDSYVKIKVPYGWNIFWTMGTALEAMVARNLGAAGVPYYTENAGKSANDAALDIFSTMFSLVDIAGTNLDFSSNKVRPENVGQILLNQLLPSLLKPVWAAKFSNVSWTGGYVMPPGNHGKQKLKNITFGYSGPMAEWTAESLDKLSGEDLIRPDNFFVDWATQWSPDQLRYLYDSMTGGLGTSLREILDVASKVEAGRFKSLSDLTRLPLIRSSLTANTEPMTTETFYEGMSTVSAMNKAFNSIETVEEREETRRRYPNLYRLIQGSKYAKSSNWYYKKVNELQNKIKDAQRAGNTEGDDLAEELREQRKNLMYAFNKKYAEAVKKDKILLDNQ